MNNGSVLIPGAASVSPPQAPLNQCRQKKTEGSGTVPAAGLRHQENCAYSEKRYRSRFIFSISALISSPGAPTGRSTFMDVPLPSTFWAYLPLCLVTISWQWQAPVPYRRTPWFWPCPRGKTVQTLSASFAESLCRYPVLRTKPYPHHSLRSCVFCRRPEYTLLRSKPIYKYLLYSCAVS